MQTSSLKRWTVLVAVATVMMMGYVFWDIISPVSTYLKLPALEGGLGWTASEYGFYAGSYSFFNIFLLMLFFGGIILDRFGIRITGLLATGAMTLGAFINWWAIARMSPDVLVQMPFTLFGLIPEELKRQVLVASLGFALFGMGCDITGITVSKIVTKWFVGRELATAMGVQVAMARLGTASALSFAPLIANTWGISSPILVGAVLLLAGMIIFIAYCMADRRRDQAEKAERASRQAVVEAAQAEADSKETYSLRDFRAVLRNQGFWLIAFLCLLFYASIRPFMKFASDLLVQQFGISPETAGFFVAIIPYSTMVLTPLFGMLYDRLGRGTVLMLTGCSCVLVSHLLLATPALHGTFTAVLVMLLIGVSFSLVPSAMWPSVPKIVPLKQLGTAYSIIYFIQNIGLMLVPIWVGGVIDSNTTAQGVIDYQPAMLIFSGLAALAVAVALVLLVVDKRNGYGLYHANIQ